jgi:hypothetical protein
VSFWYILGIAVSPVMDAFAAVLTAIGAVFGSRLGCRFGVWAERFGVWC